MAEEPQACTAGWPRGGENYAAAWNVLAELRREFPWCCFHTNLSGLWWALVPRGTIRAYSAGELRAELIAWLRSAR